MLNKLMRDELQVSAKCPVCERAGIVDYMCSMLLYGDIMDIIQILAHHFDRYRDAIERMYNLLKNEDLAEFETDQFYLSGIEERLYYEN